ncbi:MAG: DUF350 domain-containing protein [Verrucomicrobia bacterium]|nr:DUF350 domain-containing protein [Verrucomicrobiota bacterium]|tara:strand:+ start:25328 stop:26218 length:891 start_codon:yes stop_codon:yes gene_type:complete
MIERIQDWLDLQPLYDLFLAPSALYFVLALLLVFLARMIKSAIGSIDLNEELVHKDNKAVAVEMAGFTFAVMIVIASTFKSSPIATETVVWKDLGLSAAWSLIAIALVLVSAFINDRFLLSKFNNRKELVEDRNVGTGAVIAGTYLGTALIASASLQGTTGGSFGLELFDTLVFFIVGQAAFILLGLLYQKSAGYDIHEEIEKDNEAAGVALGMTLLAMGWLLSGKIAVSDSLIALVAWAVISMFVLLFSRFLIDRFLLPGSSLDHEIKNDRNWGAALIEGSAVLGLAQLLNASFL